MVKMAQPEGLSVHDVEIRIKDHSGEYGKEEI